MPEPSVPDRACVLLTVSLLLAGCGGGGGESGPAATAAVPSGGARGGASLARPPRVEDVLLVTIDTLRADALRYAGRSGVETPAIDRLAASGIAFTNAHAHNVVTLPSHTNILTGLLPYQHGVRDNTGFVVPASIPSAAAHFASAGFATAAVVGAWVLHSSYGLARDFELYDESFTRAWGVAGRLPERPGSEVVARGLDWWRANDGRRRFLWLHLYDPHTPYEPPEPFASRYHDAPYLGEVAATDSFLAPLLEPFLDGQERPALIVLTADHGEALGDHGELTHGFFAYEETLRVPLVLWAPGIEARADDRLVRHIDLLPTMLDAAGLDIDASLTGRSLFTPFEHEETVSYLESASAYLNRGWAPLRGIVRGDHKFISVPLPELYDLASDPDETTNLVQSERRRLAELRALLPVDESWPPRFQEDVSDQIKGLLLSLGYLTGEVDYKTSFTAADDPKNMIGLDRKLHEAIDALNRGELDLAATTTRDVLAVRPMEVGYSLLAQILRRQDRHAEAVEVLERAVATGLAPASTVRDLALALTFVGRQQDALKLMLPFRDSEDVASLNALASVLTEAGRLEEAHAILTRALELDADNPITHETLALVTLRAGRWEETRRAAAAALAIDDSLSLAWNYLGGALYNLGRRREAVDAWEKSVENDPQGYDAMFNMGLVAKEIGDTARARRALRLFVDTAPPDRYGADIARARAWSAELDG
jgi:arylsulfatase A-like enzyme/Flp pilus assembly protein TadD